MVVVAEGGEDIQVVVSAAEGDDIQVVVLAGEVRIFRKVLILREVWLKLLRPLYAQCLLATDSLHALSCLLSYICMYPRIIYLGYLFDE